MSALRKGLRLYMHNSNFSSRLPWTLRWIRLQKREKVVVEQILQTTGGWIARHMNKPLSVPVSIFLARWGVSPNQITAFNLLLGLLSGYLAAHGSYGFLVAGALLFQLVSVIDGCDGEVAKLNKRETRFGAWFDTIGDNLSFVAFLVGVTVGVYRISHAAWILWASKISLVSFSILLSIMLSYLFRKKVQKASLVTYEKEVLGRSLEGKRGFWVFLLRYSKYLIKKDFFAFLFLVLALAHLPQVIVFLAALGTFSVSVVLTVITLKGRQANAPVLTETSTKTAESQ